MPISDEFTEYALNMAATNIVLLVEIYKRGKNSGCTLPETEYPHIFDSFWRGSNAGNNKGSGLGLYICRQLMYKMNGGIFAEIVNGFMIITVIFPKV